ncbi:MAG: 50S ribosomal protein L4 [Candidatus Magasanikbacteria bacterium CG10_big_fil_rev_8_21_14_0_10_40_10]|uniref:Large ribosomal subunit protein uL4 n=1 Tax=Candidatus Magasanikbacteria bacterium CG10_big_fil_rev_8_21_14_0_10_40_10 TaxID=1974648 RepID=A0A2M6W585_9BACT|nr:MAG: 50S ribosomal protein L4 [Candidatus Magasanikbacteria bacterium CG10_big_fil_rev_8_21_14_0_10_40_10]
MKIKVYNLDGQASAEMEVSKTVFGVKIRNEVVHEVFVSQMANQRQPWAHSKGKGEISGGGKKPWAQKGTGRARHGSIRSPLWKGGGVVFGPLNIRNYDKKINKKTRQKALRMCLSDLVANANLVVVENFSFSEPKTKLFSQLLNKLPLKRKNCLIVTEGKDEAVMRMTKNLPKTEVARAQDLSVRQVLSHPAVLASASAIKKIEEILTAKKD